MLELWKSLSDDQIALVGCATALLVAGTIMSLSYYLGRGRIAAGGLKAGGATGFGSQNMRFRPPAAPAIADERRDAA